MTTHEARIDTRALAEEALKLIPADMRCSVKVAELDAQLESLLYGDRQLALAFAGGLLTSEEASDGVAARVETWLVHRSAGTLLHGEWDAGDFAAVIRSALERWVNR